MGVALGLVSLLVGCGQSPPPAPPAPAQPPAPAPAPAAKPKAPEEPWRPQISYEAKGRREPFRQPKTEAGERTGLQVASVKLVGIVRGPEGPLALVEAPDGVGYILRAGDLIGDARVAEIGPDSVTFAVRGRPGQPATTTVLKLKTD